MKRGQANFVLLSCCLWLGMGGLRAGGGSFEPATDAFSFANETVMAHPQRPPSKEVGTAELAENAATKYSRRCFVLTRAALQFHRHAQFVPEAPPLSPSEYRKQVRQLVRRSAWRTPKGNEAKIVFPGYPDLRHFSRQHARMLQEELGAGLPTYFRLANWRMVFPFTPKALRDTADRLARLVASGRPQAVYVTRWTDINHAILVYEVKSAPEGGFFFAYYDPNLPDARQMLHFDGDSFVFPESFYFAGGEVGLYLIYTHALD